MGLVQCGQAIPQDLAYLRAERIIHEPLPRLSPYQRIRVACIAYRPCKDGQEEVLGAPLDVMPVLLMQIGGIINAEADAPALAAVSPG